MPAPATYWAGLWPSLNIRAGYPLPVGDGRRELSAGSEHTAHVRQLEKKLELDQSRSLSESDRFPIVRPPRGTQRPLFTKRSVDPRHRDNCDQGSHIITGSGDPYSVCLSMLHHMLMTLGRQRSLECSSCTLDHEAGSECWEWVNEP